MEWTVTVVPDVNDGHVSVAMQCGSSLYMINVPEGVQRMIQEYQVRLAKLRAVFSTRSSWMGAMAGIPGMLLTVYDMGIRKVDWMAPKDTSCAAFPLFGSFFRRPDMTVTTHAVDTPFSHTWVDDASGMHVHAIGIKTVNIIRTAAYLFVPPTARGTFHPDRARALGVPRGPLFAKLASGSSVTLDDGSVVEPHQVLSASRPGPRLLVVDAPNGEDVDALIGSSALMDALKKDQTASGSAMLRCVLHLTPWAEWTTAYRAWAQHLDAFGEDVTHVVLCGADLIPLTPVHLSFSALQSRLHAVSPRHYPRPFWDQVDASSLFAQKSKEIEQHVSERFRIPVVPESFALMPMKRAKEAPVGLWKWQSDREDDKAVSIAQNIPRVPCSAVMDDPMIICLGTGAAMPSRYRNVSATLLMFSEHQSILLDCGEGTLGQIRRRFGSEKWTRVVLGIVCICVSHMHADHHLGLLSILEAKHALGQTETCPIVAPKPLYTFLEEMEKVCAHTNVVPWSMHPLSYPSSSFRITLSQGILDMVSVPVTHAPDSHAFAWTGTSPTASWKVVYSGDTRPDENLVQVGLDADVLIHEATFDHALLDEAVEKAHSTNQEALDIALRMRASFCLLFHFSQRYPVIPPMPKGPVPYSIAFDFLSVRISDLSTLPSHHARIAAMFEDRLCQIEERLAKRKHAQACEEDG